MPLEAEATLRENLHVGDLVIAYGLPSEQRGGVIGLFPTSYVRLIPRDLWTDELLDYGRPSGR